MNVIPLLIAVGTFKQQAKSVVKFWPRDSLHHAQAHELLAKLYGFKCQYQYLQCLKLQNGLCPEISQAMVLPYSRMGKKLAVLAGINEIQAKNLIV